MDGVFRGTAQQGVENADNGEQGPLYKWVEGGRGVNSLCSIKDGIVQPITEMTRARGQRRVLVSFPEGRQGEGRRQHVGRRNAWFMGGTYSAFVRFAWYRLA